MTAPSELFCFDDITLDIQRRRVSRDADSIHLSRLSFDLLKALAEAAPSAVSHEELIRRIWGDKRVITPENLSQRILILRKSLADDTASPRYIESVRGFGYRLVPEVRRVDSDFNDALHRSEARQIVGIHDRRLPIFASVVLAVVVLSASGFAYRLLWRPAALTDYYEISLQRPLLQSPSMELDAEISPDGRFIAYAAGRIGKTDIFVRQIDGGNAINLTENLEGPQRWPRWSPDGTRIAFVTAWPGANDAIRVVSALGGPAQTIVREPWLGGHAWSPIDENEIVYTTRGAQSGVYRFSISSGETWLLTNAFEPHSPSWSPDGRLIAYVSGNSSSVFGTAGFANIAPSSLRVISPDGQVSAQITDNESLNVSPGWAEDSRSLYFISRRHGSHDVYQIALAGIQDEFSEPYRVTIGLNAHSVTIDHTRRSLVYSVIRSASNIWSLAIPRQGQLDTPVPKRITSGNRTIEVFDVSLDGQWLVYDSNSLGNQDIFKRRLRGGPEIALTDDPADDFSPSLSPNHDAVAFHSVRNGNRDVYEVPIDGGKPRLLTGDPSHDWQPDYSPDGDRLVFYSNRTGPAQLYIKSRADKSSDWSEERQLTFNGGVFPQWAPTGDLIAYLTMNESQSRTLTLISPEGGDPTVIDLRPEISPDYATWSHDGQSIYVKGSGANGALGVWAIPVRTNEAPRFILSLEDIWPGSVRFEFRADETNFYFSVSERDSDIWIASLEKAAD